MTKQVAYKVLSEFWCWYGDVVKTVSRITSNEHELSALDEIGKNQKSGELRFTRNSPHYHLIRTNGLEPSRCYSLEPETSASTNSATCALE